MLFTDACIQNQYSHVRLDRAANLLHLFEELALLFMPPRGVNNDHLEFLFFEFGDTLSSDGHWVSFCV